MELFVNCFGHGVMNYYKGIEVGDVIQIKGLYVGKADKHSSERIRAKFDTVKHRDLDKGVIALPHYKAASLRILTGEPLS